MDNPSNKFVVHAYCTGIGWAETKYDAPTVIGARALAYNLKHDDNAWITGQPLDTRQVRVFNRELGLVVQIDIEA